MRTGKGSAFWLLSMFMILCLTEASWAAISDELFVELCEKGTVQGIRIALSNGANPNARGGEYGRTALIAALDNDLEVLSILLDAGADVNARDNNAVTALMVASTENPEAVSLLLEAGADVNAKTGWGMTALMIAASLNKTPEILSLLLNAGADIDARDRNNSTALMFAVLNNPNPDILSFLLNAGADITAKDDYGLTALDIARRDANKSVQQVLEDAALILK